LDLRLVGLLPAAGAWRAEVTAIPARPACRASRAGGPRGGGFSRLEAVLLALFAGIYVSDYEAATKWYARLIGGEPSFIPNDTEAVWELGEHRSIYINVRPGDAGHSVVTIFVDDLGTCVAGIAERGIEPAKQETYGNGVRKVVYRDPDGNQIGFGGAPSVS
jgi:hypothetical protein